MKSWSDEVRNETINKLHAEFKTWQSVIVVNEPSNYVETSSLSAPSFIKNIFNCGQSQVNYEIEIDNYLNDIITPTLPKATDVY